MNRDRDPAGSARMVEDDVAPAASNLLPAAARSARRVASLVIRGSRGMSWQTLTDGRQSKRAQPARFRSGALTPRPSTWRREGARPGSEAAPGRSLLYFGGPGWTGLLQDERRHAGRVGEMWDGRTVG